MYKSKIIKNYFYINCLFNQLEDQDEEAQIEIMEHFAL